MNRNIFLLLFFVLLVFTLQASGIVDSSDSVIYEISGKIRLIGNAPFSQLVITDENGKNFIISKEYYPTFKKLIYTKVTISSKIEEEELHSADSKYTKFRYFLIDPVIIKDKQL